MEKIKILLLFLFTAFISSSVKSQSFLSLGGGYSFGTIEDTSASTSGFKIKLEYEYLTHARHLAVGFQTGYHQLQTDKVNGRLTRFKAVPMAGYLKYYLGKEKLRGYAKGLFGLQSSRYKFEGPYIETQNWDIGLLFGGGAGASLKLNDKLHLDFEYELDYYNNSYYHELLANSLSLSLQLELD